jgi:DNA adenine methylase
MEEFGLLASEGGNGRAPRVYSPPPPTSNIGEESTYTQPPGNHVNTFPYPGRKGRQSEWILSKLPAHDTYVEVFGGSGALLYNKSVSQIEVYNDINDDLTQFFSVLRDREDDLVEFLEAVPYSRSLYNDWVEDFFNGIRPEDPVERAGRFFTLRYMAFTADTSRITGFKTRASRSPARTFDNARNRIHELADRFSQVIIENRDYTEILAKYDDPSVDVLFYCDPPYVGKEGYYSEDFDHEAFVGQLREVENDWMVSYADLPEGLDEFTVPERERRHRMTQDGSKATERLVCNFDPSNHPQFITDETKQTKLGE